MRTGNRQHDRFVGRAAGRQAKRDLLLNEPRLDSGRLEVGLVLWLVLWLNTGPVLEYLVVRGLACPACTVVGSSSAGCPPWQGIIVRPSDLK